MLPFGFWFAILPQTSKTSILLPIKVLTIQAPGFIFIPDFPYVYALDVLPLFWLFCSIEEPNVYLYLAQMRNSS